MTKAAEKKPLWRIVACALGVAAIVLMWVFKLAAGQTGGLSAADTLPMMLVSAAVTGVKVLLMASAVLLIKWIIRKFRK